MISIVKSQACKHNQQDNTCSICTIMDRETNQEVSPPPQDEQLLCEETTRNIDIGVEATEFESKQPKENICEDENKSEISGKVKLEKEREALRKLREHIMGTFLDDAVNRRWIKMTDHIETWINSEFNWVNYRTEMYNINVNISWEESTIVKEVPSGMWHEFLDELDNRSKLKYRNYVTEIVKTIQNFEEKIAHKFRTNGYLEEKFLEEFSSREYDQITSAVQDNSIRSIFKSVRKRFLDILIEYNMNFYKNEIVLQDDVMTKLMEHYNEKMKEFMTWGPHGMDNLKAIHQKLVTELIKLYIHVMGYTLGILNNDIIQKCEKLRVSLENELAKYESSNFLKITQLHSKTKEIISNCQVAYIKEINEIVNQQPNGVNESSLQAEHIRLKLKVGEKLESEIRSKIGIDEPVEGYKAELRYLMNSYFEKIVKLNRDNLEKAAQETQLDNSTSYTTPAPNMSSVLPNAGEDKPQEINGARLVVDFKNCRDLQMAVKQNNKSQILLNEFNDPVTPAIVGYSYTDNKFTYGKNATKLWTQWNLAHQLDTDHYNSKSITVEDGSSRIISFEFLLAFLLRKLKYTAEIQAGNIFSCGVIIIPFWFSSVHRLKIKDGAKLAGFSSVHLVHESSCAALACIPQLTSENLLVISENDNKVKAFQFHCNKIEGKVQMISFWDIYNVKQKNKAFSKLSSEKDRQEVRESITNRLTEISQKVHVGTWNIHITGSGDSREMLYEIAKDFGNVIDHPTAVLDGALDLKINSKNINESMQDILSNEIFIKYFRCKKQSFACVPTQLPFVKHIETQNCSVKFLQQNEFDKEKHCVMELDVHNFNFNQKAKIQMVVDGNGILECKTYIPISAVTGEKCSKTDGKVDMYYPNLHPTEFQVLDSWLDQLLPKLSQEIIDITQAKKNLVQLCAEMSEKIESEIWYIESRICKVQVLDQINVAKIFAEHQRTSLDDLKAQTEILQKLYDIYSKKQK